MPPNLGREIRTYLSFSQPIDPAQVFTLADMDMSYALAGTLVDWDDDKQILSGLASRWDASTKKALRFTLSEKARWSNGVAITSEDVKRSMERAKRTYGGDLKSLFDSIDQIVCIDSKTIEFRLHEEGSTLSVLKKLTEPMYGVLRVLPGDQIDLSVTTGPYFLSDSKPREVTLLKNHHWVHVDEGLANQITLRQPKTGQDMQTTLMTDKWPNLVASNSLMSESVISSIQQHELKVWKRSLDRSFILTPYNGRLNSPDGFQFFHFLQSHLDRSILTRGLTGFTPSNQLFPRGSRLNFGDTLSAGPSAQIPASIRGRQLRILMSPDRVSPALKANFTEAFEKQPAWPPFSMRSH